MNYQCEISKLLDPYLGQLAVYKLLATPSVYNHLIDVELRRFKNVYSLYHYFVDDDVNWSPLIAAAHYNVALGAVSRVK